MVCVEDNNDGSILRLIKSKAEPLVDGDAERYKYVSKEVWKAWKKKQRKGTYNTGVQPNSTFENRFKKIRERVEKEAQRSKNVYGAMPKTRIQKIEIIVPKEAKKKSFTTRIHVWVPKVTTFDFTNPRNSLEDKLDKALSARRIDVNRIERIKEMIAKGCSHSKPWSPDNTIGYVGDPIKVINTVEKVLLEKEVIYYEYVKPASTITKTINHSIPYD